MKLLEAHFQNGIVSVGPLEMYDLEWMAPSKIEEDIKTLVVTWAAGTPREKVTEYKVVHPRDYKQIWPAYNEHNQRVPNANIVFFCGNVFERVKSTVKLPGWR
jgi:hypothetical protein